MTLCIINTGKVIAVCVGRRKGQKKRPVDSALLVAGAGIKGDAHAGENLRQVSILSDECIDKIRKKGLNVGPGAFAENITTKGLDTAILKIGDNIYIGKKVQLEVTQIGKECHSRCSIYHLVGDCVMPKEGIFTRVIKGGTINSGDPIRVW